MGTPTSPKELEEKVAFESARELRSLLDDVLTDIDQDPIAGARLARWPMTTSRWRRQPGSRASRPRP